MSYFGFPIDLLEALSNEIHASASMYPEAQQSMLYLADKIMALSPIYSSLCHYCSEDDEEPHKVNYLVDLHRENHELH